MGLWDKLGRASDYLRKLRLSLGPDSYFQYKRERKQADEAREREAAREREQGRAERERELAEGDAARDREYEARYAREREGDIAGPGTKRLSPTADRSRAPRLRRPAPLSVPRAPGESRSAEE
jgi:hypothetical protein